MSSRVKTQYSCDLCGEEHTGTAELKRLRSEKMLAADKMRSISVDICSSCQRRPITDLLEAFPKKAQRKADEDARRKAEWNADDETEF